MSLNLLSILENRFIVLIAKPMNLIFDTVYEEWVSEGSGDTYNYLRRRLYRARNMDNDEIV